MNFPIIVLNSVTTNGGDCTVDASGSIFLTGLVNGVSETAIFRPNWIKSFSITAGVADTPAVWTSNTTATASTTYQIQLFGMNKLTKQPDQWLSPSYTSAASTSKTLINTPFVNWINSLGDEAPFTAVLTATECVITADTSFPNFSVVNLGAGATNFTETTPGINGRGVGANIIEVGQFSSSDVVSSNVYTTVNIEFTKEVFIFSGQSTGQNSLIVYVNQADADYTALVGYDITNLIGFGTLASILYNNRKATYSAVGANVAVATNVATRASGSFFTENIKSGDMLLIGTTSALINVPYTDGATAANLIFTNATVTGSDVSSAAAKLIKFTNLP